jgi:beta-lactamase class A
MIRHAIVCAVVIGCGGGQTVAPPPPAPKPVTAAAKPAEPALPAGMPDTPAGRQLAWVLRTVANGEVDHAQLVDHFAASFLASVPEDQLRAGVSHLRGMQLVDATTGKSGNELVAHVTVGGHKLIAQLAVDGDHKITGLLFQSELDKPKTWDEADQRLRKAAPHVQVLAAELDHDTCKPIHAIDNGTELAIGSTFKLYVLLAVADRIAEGKLAWDTPIEIRDDWKSLPSGTTQNEPAGTKLTARQLADKMISISDNTAADHLLYTVGRARVEAAVRTAKHTKPVLDIPFLSTRELFMFKLGMAEGEIEKYLKSSESKRRAYLDGTLGHAKPTLDLAVGWKSARKIDRLEWFASSDDLCRVMATLQQRAKSDKLAPLLDVLAINPGVPIDKQRWPYAGYKGGSEPGVMNMSWLLRRADDRWFMLTLTANSDEGGELPDDEVIAIAAGMLDLLAGT